MFEKFKINTKIIFLLCLSGVNIHTFFKNNFELNAISSKIKYLGS